MPQRNAIRRPRRRPNAEAKALERSRAMCAEDARPNLTPTAAKHGEPAGL
jgi:hypothetical protein